MGSACDHENNNSPVRKAYLPRKKPFLIQRNYDNGDPAFCPLAFMN